MTPENIQAGFKRTGMFPFDPEAYKQYNAHSLGIGNKLGGLPLMVSQSASESTEPAFPLFYKI